MKIALVTTTIHIPESLKSYFGNFKKFGHDNIETIVIGDHKSPAETGDYLQKLESEYGYPIQYWDVEQQKSWLKEWPKLDSLLPYNSVQRRNLGYLQAVMRDAEIIISIDDDNYTTDDDYAGGHSIVGQTVSLPAVSSSRGWFNSCSVLTTSPPKPLYHRGFPTAVRGEPEELRYTKREGRVVVNAGMWLETPDADAMSHLDCPVEVTGFKDDFEGRMLVDHDTDMVFNSQNTAMHRDLISCIFLPPMGDRMGDLEVGRFDDIWMSIFVKVIAAHLKEYVCIGKPLARQARNDHDLFQDMLVELPAMRLTNKMIRTIGQIEFSGTDYHSCYVELIDKLRTGTNEAPGYLSEERAYMKLMLQRMETWAEICEQVLAGAV